MFWLFLALFGTLGPILAPHFWRRTGYPSAEPGIPTGGLAGTKHYPHPDKLL